MTELGRPLTGYGLRPPALRLRHDARIAVSVVINYEEGSESTPLDGDEFAEAAGEFGDGKRRTVRNFQVESQWEYGSRVGSWRLIQLLKRYNVTATVFACALALERNPSLAEAIVADGHEVCGHGYRWLPQWHMSEAEEAKSIQLATESLTRSVGKPPLGWFTRGGPSPNTRSLLQASGYIYDCDAFNDDLPYFVEVNGRQWVVVPYAFDTNDSKFWKGGWGSGLDFFEYLRSTFDYLYEEGKNTPKMMTVALHSRVSGRPGRAAAVARFLDYALGHDDVWFATRYELANWWLECNTNVVR